MSPRRLFLGGCLLLASCGGEPAPTFEDLREVADAAYARGDWHEAYEAYHDAYALEDPVEERRAHRAFLAFRVARCLVRSTIEHADSPDVSSRRIEFMCDDALLWLAETAALDENEYWVWFERGLIFDRVGPCRDLRLAREAYETFLRIHDERTDPPVPPAEEMSGVKTARDRLKELGG